MRSRDVMLWAHIYFCIPKSTQFFHSQPVERLPLWALPSIVLKIML